jgi:hypothetical protein
MRMILLSGFILGLMPTLMAPAAAAMSREQALKECKAQYSSNRGAYLDRMRSGASVQQQVAACVKAKTGK